MCAYVCLGGVDLKVGVWVDRVLDECIRLSVDAA